MVVKLKSVQPHLDETDEVFDFTVEVESQGRVQTLDFVTAETLLDQYEFAVLVAKRLGFILQRESNWRGVLAEAWRSPQATLALSHEFEDGEDDMILVGESPLAAG